MWEGDQWASYDDADTFAMKIDYANQHCLGGTMVWAVSLDARGTAASALERSTGRRAAIVQGDKGVASRAQAQTQTQTSGGRSLKAPRLL